MRYIAAIAILCCLPLVMSWLKAGGRNREYALLFLGMGFFLGGALQIEVSPIVWPVWAGTVKGVTISLIDVVAMAVIFTRGRQPKVFPLVGVILSYLVTIMISGMTSAVPMASFFYVFQIFRFLILFIAIVPEVGNPRLLRALLRGFAAGVIVQCGFVISQKLHGVVQAAGTLPHQNQLGMMVELAILPLVGALLGGERNTLIKAGVLAGLVVIAGGGSRGTMAIIAVSLIGLLLLSLAQGVTPIKTKLLGAGVVAAVIAVPLGYATLNKRFAGDVSFAEDEQRGAMERAARMMAADHVLGVGPNLYVSTANVQGYSQRANVTWGGNTRAAPVHNSFLLARAETGYLGMALFLALFLAPMFIGYRYAFRYRRTLDGSVVLGSTIALSAIAFHSQYEYAAQTMGPQSMIFLNIAIIAGFARYRRLHRGSDPATRKRPKTQDAQPAVATG